MGVFAKADLEVDIDLQGAMLQVASSAMKAQEGGDADLAQLVSGLEREKSGRHAPGGRPVDGRAQL